MTLQEVRQKADGAYDQWPDEVLRARFNAKYPGVLTDAPASNIFSPSGNRANDVLADINKNQGKNVSDINSYYEAKGSSGTTKTYGAGVTLPSTPSQTTTNTAPKKITQDSTTNFDRAGAKAAGYTDAEINAFLNKQGRTQTKLPAKPSVPPKENMSLGGFAGNVVKSGVENAKNIGGALVNVLNPNLEKNTVANLARLPFDAGQAAAGDTSKTNRFNALKDFYVQRYGSMDAVKKAAYEDPVGVALDASVVLEGAGAIAKTAGNVSKVFGLTRTGEGLSNASRVVDPLAQTGKLVSKAGDKLGELKNAEAEKAALRSSKASPTAQMDFADKAGMDIGEYMTKKDLHTVKDVQAYKKVVQGLYDDSVKTGKVIKGKQYADAIRAQAAEIVKNDRSPSARAVADKLEAEAIAQEKLGDITDKVLTKTKTGSFSKAPGTVMSDPIAVNFDKELGKAGLKTLDSVAPGSARLGKELQALTELEDTLKTGSYKGRSGNILSALKPSGVGAGVGFAAGGFPGAAAGAVIANMIDSPTGQRVLSKTLSGAKMPEIAKTATPIAYETGRISSRLMPPIDQFSQGGSKTILPQGSQSQTGSYSDGTTAPTESQGISTNTFVTGQSPEYWNNQYQQAMNAGDEITAKYANDQYAKEVTNQTKGPEKLTAASQLRHDNLQTALSSLNAAEVNLETGGGAKGPIFGGVMTLPAIGQYTNPAGAAYHATKIELATQLAKAITGGSRPGAEVIKAYLHSLPDVNDTPEFAQAKIDKIRSELLQQAKAFKYQDIIETNQ